MPKTSSVLFLAMSGVRIYDPELTALGMTLPGFVERGKVIASMPSLGLLNLAGLTPDSWEVVYRDVDEVTDEVLEDLKAERAGLIAISSLAARIREAYALADALRGAGKKVVLGGLHVSALPEEAAQHADAVVAGEGESVWAQVLEDFANGELKPIYRSERSRDWPPYAMPAYHLLDPDRYNRIPVQTTRGCPLDCSFCAASRLISAYKRKPLERVEAELESIRAFWPKPFVELADDNTFVHKAWGKDLAAVLKRQGVRWFTETDVSVADDPQLLEALADSGCAQLLIGFESVDTSALAEADTKAWKQKRRDRYIEAIKRIQSTGISVNGCFAFGFDADSPETFEATFEFVRESGLSEVQVTILTPFPGTALYRKLLAEGRLHQERFWEKCTLFDVTFEPKGMSAEELRRGFRELVRELYSDRETERRRALLRSGLRKKLLKPKREGAPCKT